MKVIVFDCETSGIPLAYDYTKLVYFTDARLLQLGYLIFDVDTQELITARDILCTPPTPSTICPVADLYTSGRATVCVKDALIEFVNHITSDTILVAHNLRFDMNIILSEIFRLGATNQLDITTTMEYITRISTCKHICTYQAKFKLKLIHLYQRLFGREFIQVHDALQDVMATTACFLALSLQGYLPEVSLEMKWPDTY